MNTDNPARKPHEQLPLEGMPTWVRALQAAVIGVIAGLALNAIVSMVVHGANAGGVDVERKSCRKAAPAKEVVAPPASRPQALSSGVQWSMPGDAGVPFGL